MEFKYSTQNKGFYLASLFHYFFLHVMEVKWRGKKLDLIFKICETWSSNNVKMLVMLMWSLWRRRNVKLWDSIEETSEAVQMRANVVIQDWKLAESFHQRY